MALAEVPVLLCLRNRAAEGREGWEGLLQLITDNSDRLGLAFKPGAACRAGWDPLPEWPRFGRLVRHFYVTDAAGSLPAAVGAGDVPWEELMARHMPIGDLPQEAAIH